ncbi:hypothetical protein WN51_07083 [Melipona quadrifasciata]|uniref:Uncharacterized protein n=1 Tax=Melipona quadrifasciata TaxID=166423 RepID=A0A0M8ZPB8_9HYME|nr:hypothetical protein WN51_07083 [Melipona quadrifasciata]
MLDNATPTQGLPHTPSRITNETSADPGEKIRERESGDYSGGHVRWKMSGLGAASFVNVCCAPLWHNPSEKDCSPPRSAVYNRVILIGIVFDKLEIQTRTYISAL